MKVYRLQSKDLEITCLCAYRGMYGNWANVV